MKPQINFSGHWRHLSLRLQGMTSGGAAGHQRRLLQGRGAAAVNLHRTEPEEAPGWGALNFDYTGLWTALRCSCTGGTSLDFTCFLIFCSQLRFSPLTLTPVTPSGKTETQAACLGSLWPCTGKLTRIKGCEWCALLHFSAVQISEGSPECFPMLMWEIKTDLLSEFICVTAMRDVRNDTSF